MTTDEIGYSREIGGLIVAASALLSAGGLMIAAATWPAFLEGSAISRLLLCASMGVSVWNVVLAYKKSGFAPKALLFGVQLGLILLADSI